MVFLYLAHNLLGRELLVVVDEDGSSGKPLTVEFTPYGLAPTRIGHGEMDAVLIEIVPIDARRQMSQGIEEVVGHHLGLATRAAGEVHQHRVVVVVDETGTMELRSLRPLVVEVVESLGHGLRGLRHAVDGNKHLHRRTLGQRALNLSGHVLVVAADDGLHRGALIAIGNILRGEHVGGGNGNGAQLVQGKHREPPLIVTLQDEHHLVAMTDAELLKVGCGLVGLLLQVLEGGSHLLTALAGPQQGHLVGSYLCPLIHHVVGEIEILWYPEMQILLEVFL